MSGISSVNGLGFYPKIFFRTWFLRGCFCFPAVVLFVRSRVLKNIVERFSRRSLGALKQKRATIHLINTCHCRETTPEWLLFFFGFHCVQNNIIHTRRRHRCFVLLFAVDVFFFSFLISFFLFFFSVIIIRLDVCVTLATTSNEAYACEQ